MSISEMYQFHQKIMKFKLFFIALIMCCVSQVTAQANKSEITKITETLVDYIEGSTNGQPNR